MTTLNIYRNIILAAAAAISCAAAGYGQTMTATVDFPFAAAGRTQPAGTYEVRRTDSPTPLFVLRNAGTGKAVLLLSPYSSEARDGYFWSINFACAPAGCRLGGLRMGDRTYAGPDSIKPPAADERSVAVALRPVRIR